MTRGAAIDILFELVAKTARDSRDTSSYLAGARAMLDALAAAGAFDDGRNMQDRLPSVDRLLAAPFLGTETASEEDEEIDI